jgi:putative ABC transport system substrate-binding protein
MPSAAANVLRSPTPCHHLYRRATAYVDRLLRGAQPVDLAVEEPPQYDLVFHRLTALALGLTLPASLIEQADEVLG